MLLVAGFANTVVQPQWLFQLAVVTAFVAVLLSGRGPAACTPVTGPSSAASAAR